MLPATDDLYAGQFYGYDYANASTVSADTSPYLPGMSDGTLMDSYPGIGVAMNPGMDAISGNQPMAMEEPQQAAIVGASGNPAITWLGLAIGLAVLWYLSSKADIGNIKPGAFNLIIILLVSLLGSGILKVFFSKVKVPGVSSLILAS